MDWARASASVSPKQVGALLFWYAGSVANNMSAKIALQSFPYPFTLALIGMVTQFVLTAIKYRPHLQRSEAEARRRYKANLPIEDDIIPISAILPASLGALCAFFCHKLALQASTISFTLTVKSVGTVIVALMSTQLLDAKLSGFQWLAILGVMAGIGCSTYADTTFSWPGLVFALASAAGQSLQVVWMKKLTLNGTWTHLRVCLYVSCLSLVVALPIVVYKEFGTILQDQMAQKEIGFRLALLNGVCLCWMEVGALLFLFQSSPVVHGVANGVRSVAVILVSVIYFGKSVTFLNGAGMLMAVGSVVAYSIISQRKVAAAREKEE